MEIAREELKEQLDKVLDYSMLIAAFKEQIEEEPEIKPRKDNIEKFFDEKNKLKDKRLVALYFDLLMDEQYVEDILKKCEGDQIREMIESLEKGKSQTGKSFMICKRYNEAIAIFRLNYIQGSA